MALQLLTLRPPPNVDFISGYPGLAPGPPDRPHAAVIGTLELRTPQPIKAKWVHVELRKIESVPGSPPFVDIIGSKPTVVWEPQGSEYGVLQSVSILSAAVSTVQPPSFIGVQDFYFSIRIPESAPPTVSLDAGRAGIRYELIATMCGKGKRSLLRRESSPLQVTSTDIVILKHEMHATWPVYAQPEERRAQKDGMYLSVSRGKTCLGAANDHITMQAVLHAEMPISLKSFELALVQKLAYPNAGASQMGKKGTVAQPPPARSSLISEQKRPINVRIQPGMHQTCELTCMLPPNYTAMTVATARLIENTYEVHVSAILDGGGSISVGMPITVSPFPIAYSMEMMQRIGMPPMALDDPARAHLHQQQQQQASRPASAASNKAGSMMQDPKLSHMGGPPIRQQKPYHIAERVGGQVARDESLLGGPPSPTPSQPMQVGTLPAGYGANGRPGTVATNTYPGDARSPAVNEFGQPIGAVPDSYKAFEAPQPLQPVSPTPAATITSLGRFAVVNATQRDEPDSPRSSRMHEPYLTAADEKKRLAEQMANPDGGYASIPPPGPPPPSSSQPYLNGTRPSEPKVEDTKGQNTNNQAGGTSSSQQSERGKWLSAEQEKQRLFENAKAAADLTQRRAVNSSAGAGGGSMSKASSPRDKQQFSESQITPSSVISSSSFSGDTKNQTSSSSNSTSLSPAPTQKSSTGGKKWVPAEEEKRKLYEKAQARALKTQARAAGAASGASGVGRSNSTLSATGSVTSSIANPYAYSTSTSGLKGADLYKSAMNNVKVAAATVPSSPPASFKQTPPLVQATLTPPPVTPPVSVQQQSAVPVTVTPPPAVTPSRNGSNWLSAEDEKARLRYLDAKRAVDRHVAAQEDDFGAGGSGGGQYDAPSGSSQYAAYASPPPTDHQPWSMPPLSPPINNLPPSVSPTPEPPPFEPSFGYTHATDIPEKEKMRLAFEQQGPGVSSNAPPDYTMPPAGSPPSDAVPSYGGFSPTPMTQDSILSATEEKARLRAQFAAQDALNAGSGSGSGSGSTAFPPTVYSKPSPVTPMSADGSRTLSAAEEKARIMALQAAERPISSVAPLPPPRIKSPVPSTPLSAISEHNRSAISDYSRPPTVSLMSSSSASSANDDHLRRDPSISQGKQRAPSSEIKLPFVVPPPPPLMPRPPVEYIEKTKQEDMKIRRMTQDTTNMTVYGEKPGGENGNAPWLTNGFLNSPDTGFSLGLRPFSPLDLSLETSSNTPPIGQQSTPNGQRPSYYNR